MSDERIEQARRAYTANPSPENGAALLRGRIRAGDLVIERVQLAALLGDEAARTVWPLEHKLGLPEWLKSTGYRAGNVLTRRRVPCYINHPSPYPHDCVSGTNGRFVLATEACGCWERSMSQQGGGPNSKCSRCHGTGQHPETLRRPFLVRSAAKCARLALNRTPWHDWERRTIWDTIDAADVWALDPNDESLRAWIRAWMGVSTSANPWMPWPEDDPDALIRRILSAASATSDGECLTAIRGLASWVLNG